MKPFYAIDGPIRYIPQIASSPVCAASMALLSTDLAWSGNGFAGMNQVLNDSGCEEYNPLVLALTSLGIGQSLILVFTQIQIRNANNGYTKNRYGMSE